MKSVYIFQFSMSKKTIISMRVAKEQRISLKAVVDPILIRSKTKKIMPTRTMVWIGIIRCVYLSTSLFLAHSSL